jgi:hypothetical protein
MMTDSTSQTGRVVVDQRFATGGHDDPQDPLGARHFQEEIVRSSCDSSTLANTESFMKGMFLSYPQRAVSLPDVPQ